MKTSKRTWYVIASLLITITLTTSHACFSSEAGLPGYVSRSLIQENLAVLSVPLNDDTLRIVSASNYGGAIVSLTFRGRQYVNDDNGYAIDYGRQIQSAVSYDDMGECFNPTEAGGSYDEGNAYSSSRTLSSSVVDRSLRTRTEMAFWLRPDIGNTKCSSLWKETGVTSNDMKGYIVSKSITAGDNNNDNVIRYQVKFLSPVTRKTGIFEPVSVHLTSAFNKVYIWKNDKEVHEFNGEATRSNYPIILSTDDNKHALGHYAPSHRNEKSWYGFKKWPNTNIIRYVIDKRSIFNREESFEGYLVIGTMEEVLSGINRIASTLAID